MKKIFIKFTIIFMLITGCSILNAGTLLQDTLYSNIAGQSYSYYVYLPDGYDENLQQEYPSVYFQDGSSYIYSTSARHLIDTLINKNYTDEIVGVFVDPFDRTSEYLLGGKGNYAKFLALELAPFIDSNYRTIKKSSDRLVVGLSYGGNVSAYIAYKYPEVFGNCGLQSAAFKPTYDVYYLITRGEKKPIRFHSTWGTDENPIHIDMRKFRDTLLTKGYNFEWTEYEGEQHTFSFWRKTLPEMLKYFFPKTITSVDDNSFEKSFYLTQNYPNPFNPSTSINFDIPERGNVKIILYDITGKKVKELLNENKSKGSHTLSVNLNGYASGIYIYTIQVKDLSKNNEGFTASRKMILMK